MSSCKKDNSDNLTEGEELSSAKFNYKVLNTSIDSLQYNHPLELDLNNDNQVDYYLSSVLVEVNDLPYLYLFINRKTPNLNKVLVRPGEELAINGLWAVPLDAGTKIEATPTTETIWNDDQSKAYLLNLMDNGINRIFGGEWLNKKDKYLGLKFIINGEYHYGWLRISHNLNEAKLAIKDFAYNKQANEFIRAGEK